MNFRVDLHKERMGGISPTKSKKNLSLVSDKLKSAGLNEDVIHSMMKVNLSPTRYNKG